MPNPANTTGAATVISCGKATGAAKNFPSTTRPDAARSARYSIRGTGCRNDFPSTGFNPILANSLAAHSIATSEPRCSDSLPSSAGDAMNFRSVRSRSCEMFRKPASRSSGWAAATPASASIHRVRMAPYCIRVL